MRYLHRYSNREVGVGPADSAHRSDAQASLLTAPSRLLSKTQPLRWVAFWEMYPVTCPAEGRNWIRELVWKLVHPADGKNHTEQKKSTVKSIIVDFCMFIS